ncbi:MAG: bifunctional folylpolyglutamate synthase/dihydrofolate synthase [Nitrospirae bacterium]|nr:bifunctional folylpolyglutamate synthase/dihydrofolate synthase [Nitrospirota bacterium]
MHKTANLKKYQYNANVERIVKLNYDKTIDYLYELRKYGIKLGLENSQKLMDILGRPHETFRSIHITGTNGKGSTSAVIASILRENGFKVGLFISPHLVSFTERIRINNTPISEYDVISLIDYIRNVITKTDIKPTFFEFVTAIAFYYFASENIDWAIIEVGMGGRLDATNIIVPDVSIITNISLEHTEFLGRSIPEIAAEKAGIIKHDVPLVTAITQPEALRVIEDTAKTLDSQIHLYGKDFNSTISDMDISHVEFNYKGYREYHSLSLHLTGRHQVCNASLAIRACEVLMQKEIIIHENAIYNGLSKLNFDGRLEIVSQTPYMIIDSAHNPRASESLADTVRELFSNKRIILVIGIMGDKDIEGILKPLIQLSETVILTRPRGERAATPERLKESVTSLLSKEENNKNPLQNLITTNTVEEAINHAKTLWHEESIILVTGSFYTAGEAKEILGYTGVLSGLRE